MFVTFEGIEGSGKSTLLFMIADWLNGKGQNPVCTREPGGSILGSKLRTTLLDPGLKNLDPTAELFLFLADRSQHIWEIIQPSLAENKIVLCDRYSDSTFAYQGYGRGLNLDMLRQLNQIASSGLVPDMTLLLDLPVETGLARAYARNQSKGAAFSEGRFDSEAVSFHNRARKGFLKLAAKESERISVINASQPVEAVFSDCISVLQKYF